MLRNLIRFTSDNTLFSEYNSTSCRFESKTKVELLRNSGEISRRGWNSSGFYRGITLGGQDYKYQSTLKRDIMWQVLESLVRKLNTIWDGVERLRQNMSGLLAERVRGQSKLHTTTDESYSCNSSDDSGFADDEGLCYVCSDTHCSSTQTRHKDSQSEHCEVNDNDFVLDSDLKNQQRITLMSLLYSRALEKKLNRSRLRKPSYSLRDKERARKHK